MSEDEPTGIESARHREGASYRSDPAATWDSSRRLRQITTGGQVSARRLGFRENGATFRDFKDSFHTHLRIHADRKGSGARIAE